VPPAKTLGRWMNESERTVDLNLRRVDI
jgi:hypothetical protein